MSDTLDMLLTLRTWDTRGGGDAGFYILMERHIKIISPAIGVCVFILRGQPPRDLINVVRRLTFHPSSYYKSTGHLM